MRIEPDHHTVTSTQYNERPARRPHLGDDSDQGTTTSRTTDQSTPGDSVELSDEAKREVERLKKVDAQVRAHEQAHLTAGGPNVTGGARFQYTQGPDGRQYAVGGEVSIDTSPVEGNPQATISKAQAITRAALAPMDPSSQDRAVAAQAAQMEARARMELSQENEEAAKERSGRQTGAMKEALDQYSAHMAGTDQSQVNEWTA